MPLPKIEWALRSQRSSPQYGEIDRHGSLNRHKGKQHCGAARGAEDDARTRDENAAATAKADYLRANLSPAAGPMETPCLVWRGSSIRGHGSIGHKNHNYRVHRLAYLIANGPIPPGLQVMHSCDNGLCCNPLHLRVGTNHLQPSAKPTMPP